MLLDGSPSKKSILSGVLTYKSRIKYQPCQVILTQGATGVVTDLVIEMICPQFSRKRALVVTLLGVGVIYLNLQVFNRIPKVGEDALLSSGRGLVFAGASLYLASEASSLS
jgi:hypothetical protein